ncbi:MAG: nicotinate-nucleotide--dimethylbenzimidazole phosphoribosyltransferase, partial [Methylococcales bacterium]|nr:nicotinate-nucleotide--dimethylbenzimidazole phosphoribosyltransferase [Methylococcales bacterium]
TIISPDAHYQQAARVKQIQLTKPEGALGALELLAIRLAAMQQTYTPTLARISVSIFASDHGIANENVSAFPQSVSVEMVKNFSAGGAAVNVLSRFIQADFEVIDVGLVQDLSLPMVRIEKLTHGTANFLQAPAMSKVQCNYALNAGKNAIQRALSKNTQLFIGGEMGIGNTTSAAAISCSLLQQPPSELVGAGTGINSQTIEHKIAIVDQALIKHHANLTTPLSILQHLGGFEIAALVGAYLFAAQNQLPVLVDGFIATSAALIAARLNPQVIPWFFYGHQSQEKGHQLILTALNAKPLLSLSMRLGEASGALVAVPLLQMACKLHNEMATFEQTKMNNNNNQ